MQCEITQHEPKINIHQEKDHMLSCLFLISLFQRGQFGRDPPTQLRELVGHYVIGDRT
jgi:hypothetical protein